MNDARDDKYDKTLFEKEEEQETVYGKGKFSAGQGKSDA